MVNWKDCRMKRSWPILYHNLYGNAEEKHEYLSQNCRPLGLHTNPEPLEYKVEVLITRQ
jgi:hypothetical protein